MKYKKTIILVVLAVFILSISCVSASETDNAMAGGDTDSIELSSDNEDNLKTSEKNVRLTSTGDDELTDNPGTYSGLSTEIGCGGNIELQHDYYTYDAGNSICINVSDSIIDGKGAVIDMAGSNIGAFHVTASGVTIKDLTIKNANCSEDGAAIYFSNSGTVINCNFINNSITGEDLWGGAVYMVCGTVKNCNFTDNSATFDGGAVYFFDNGEVTGCNFARNSARFGSAVCFNANGVASDCNFTDNAANDEDGWGGAVYMYSGSLKNCIFTANRAGNGGAVCFFNNGDVTDCNFTNNTAGNLGGAIMFDSSGNVTNCNFENNHASNGGAVYVKKYGEITGCSFIKNNATDFGGAVYFNKNSFIDNSTFKNNTAQDGGAILTNENLTIKNSAFKDNRATSGDSIAPKGNATVKLINVSYLHFTVLDGIVYGPTERIILNVTDENGNPLNNGTVTIIVNGKTYSSEVVNGSAIFEVSNLNAGSHNVNITCAAKGFDVISPVEFKVSKQNAKITASNKAYVINYGGKYTATLKDAKGNPIKGETLTFTLKGKKIGSATTNSKGVATFKFTAKMLKSAKAGKRNLVVKFTSRNYNAVSKTVKITVKKEKTKIIAKKKTFNKAKKIKKYALILKNSKNKAVKKVKVFLKVKGKTFKATTNSKGKAIFKIKKLTRKGTFKATLTFKGNAYYYKAVKKVKITLR